MHRSYPGAGFGNLAGVSPLFKLVSLLFKWLRNGQPAAMSAPAIRIYDPVAIVSGANIGFSARTYWRIGGFRWLFSGEDVDLVTQFETAGYNVHRGADLSVIASARTRSLAPLVHLPLGGTGTNGDGR